MVRDRLWCDFDHTSAQVRALWYHADREEDCACIIEFKVHKPKKEKELKETVANALSQIDEKQYEAEFIAKSFAPEQIKKYNFAFKGKECLIG